jgi:hypothetical protein
MELQRLILDRHRRQILNRDRHHKREEAAVAQMRRKIRGIIPTGLLYFAGVSVRLTASDLGREFVQIPLKRPLPTGPTHLSSA